MSDTVWTLDELKKSEPQKNFFAVLGKPIHHSLSPIMHRAAFEAAAISAQYVRIECSEDTLEPTLHELRRIGARGWNCTLPLKEAMYQLCDERDAHAEKLGAVNTVINQNGQLIGLNTDGPGWVTAVREAFGVDVRDLRILILGAGGAGRALALQAALEDCETLVIANRTFERAQQVAQDAERLFPTKNKLSGSASSRVHAVNWHSEAMRQAIRNADLVVNATALGWKLTDPSVVPGNWLLPHLLVYDTVYRPRITPFLRAAATAGARISNGLGMLLHQGAMAWSLWTGREAPISAMRHALEKALDEDQT